MKELLNPKLRDHLYSYQFHGLTLYLDNEELLEAIPATIIDGFIHGYNTAYTQFEKEVLGIKGTSTVLHTAYPPADLVLTQQRSIFKEYYHTPSKFDSLPLWVSDYVNFSRSMYVRLIQDPNDIHFDHDSAAHEFTHAIIPSILNVPTDYLSDNWPTWINESLSVGLHERRSLEWLLGEMRSGKELPTIAQIEQNGIFSIDRRPPYNNVGYQYCVQFTEAYSRRIRDTLYGNIPLVDQPAPLYALCDITQRAYRNDQSLTEAIIALGVYVPDIEAQLHADFTSRRLLQTQ